MVLNFFSFLSNYLQILRNISPLLIDHKLSTMHIINRGYYQIFINFKKILKYLVAADSVPIMITMMMITFFQVKLNWSLFWWIFWWVPESSRLPLCLITILVTMMVKISLHQKHSDLKRYVKINTNICGIILSFVVNTTNNGSSRCML